MQTYGKKKQLVGTFISDDFFITDAGIRDRIFYNKDFVTMEILFPDDELDEEAKSYVITILEKLVDSGKLIGEYENGKFRGEDALSVKKI